MKIKRNLILLLVGLTLAAASCARLSKWREVHTPPDDACLHCHYAIYKEWKIAYRPYNEGAGREDYEPVHSRPMSAADVSVERSHREGKGECSTCHIVQSPAEQLTISRLGASFTETHYELCGRCHQALFDEWSRSRYAMTDKTPCIACHAGDRETPLEGKTDYHSQKVLKGLGAPEKSPSVQLERLKRAVTVAEEITVQDRFVNILLLVSNEGVGHNLPADTANATMKLELSLSDGKGVVVGQREALFGGEGGKVVHAGGGASFDYDMPVPGAGSYRLDIVLTHTHKTRDKGRPVVLYRGSRELAVPGEGN